MKRRIAIKLIAAQTFRLWMTGRTYGPATLRNVILPNTVSDSNNTNPIDGTMDLRVWAIWKMTRNPRMHLLGGLRAILNISVEMRTGRIAQRHTHW